MYQKILYCILFSLLTMAMCFAQDHDEETITDITPYLHEQAQTAPEFHFRDQDGNTHNLKDFRGKVVLLNFWATWCKPCVAEMPGLNALQEKIGAQSLAILPVSLDYQGQKIITDFYHKHRITALPILMDHSKQAFQLFSLYAIPTTIVISPEGKELARVHDEIAWNSTGLTVYISELADQYNQTSIDNDNNY